MTLMLKQKYQQMAHHMDWEPYSYKSIIMCGNLLHMSHFLSVTEANYAQIEEDALACVWACGKFSTYVLGMQFMIETDHKPLVALFGSKRMDKLPPRIFRFRLRMARFDYVINHVAGKMLFTADTISHAPRPFTDGDVRNRVSDGGVCQRPPSQSTKTPSLLQSTAG